MAELFQALREYLECLTWDEAERIVRDHPELLGPQTPTLLGGLAIDLPPYMVHGILMPHGALLARCRDVGVSQAFAEKTAPLRVVPPPLMERFRAAVVAAERGPLLELLRDHPELRPALKREPILSWKMIAPPGFDAAMQEIARLNEVAKSDPEGWQQVVATYQDILARLQKEVYPAFRAIIENDLGAAYLRFGKFDQAIEWFQAALQFFRADTVPLEYANTQKCLGEVYRHRDTGDRGANLQKAIFCYEAALQIFTPGAAPDEYATTLTCLGVAYLELPMGDQRQDLEQAIDCFRRALPWTGPKSSTGHANLQFNLGEAFRKLPTGDRGANLQQAIEHYEQALRVHRPNSAPGLYGRIQAGLAAAHRDLSGSTDVERLARAVECFQEAVRFARPAVGADEYEALQRDANECYQQWLRLRESRLGKGSATPAPVVAPRGPAGRPGLLAQLNVLLKHLLDPAVPSRDRDEAGRQVGEVLGDILGRQVEAGEGKEFADVLAEMDRLATALRYDPGAAAALLALARQTLAALEPGQQPWLRFHLLDFCGIAYRNLPTGDAGANLTRAIECFEEALKLQSPERAPDEVGAVLNNLGNAYRNLPVGDKAANLSKAITSYEEALRLASPQDDPQSYGVRQLNLGTAYFDLPTGDLEANLGQAVVCYEEALRHLTPEAAPLEYAGAQENLGLTLRELSTGARRDNLARALRCFQEALRYRPAQSAPLPHAQAQNNLGSLYLDLAAEGSAEAKALAVNSFEAGLRVLQPEHAPRLYASLWCNLAAAHTSSFGETDPEAEARAMRCYENALQVITQESAPREYANAQAELGALLFLQSRRELEQAARALEEIRQTAARLGLPPHALTVFNPKATSAIADAISRLERAGSAYGADSWPRECRRINMTLGMLEGALGRWPEALARFRAALDAAERLYRAGLSERGKESEAAANAELHRHAAFAAVRAGEPLAAWAILERGKTRLLAEALRLGVPRRAGVLDDDWSQFVRAAAAARTLQSDRTAGDFVAGGPFRTREQAARTAEAALDDAVRRIREHATDFLGDTDLAEVRRLLDTRTALVVFCVCRFGSVALVVGHEPSTPVTVVDLPDFSQHDLDRLLAHRAGRTTDDSWVAAFREPDPKVWRGALDRVLRLLGEQLLRPLISALSPGIERLVLLPSGGLALFPLHAAVLSENPLERLLDRFLVSYAPSAEVLLNSRRRLGRASRGGLYQAVNPTEDAELPYAAREAEAVGGLVDDRLVHKGREATKKAVAAGIRGRAYVHFICHGVYHRAEPRLSGLTLADGDLTLAELQAGAVDVSAARLVVLSACETGVTDVTVGSPDEYVGLPAGFLLAGAPCLVSSLWKVADLATALLVERFFHLHLSEGRDAVAALADAQRWLRALPVAAAAEFAERCLRETGSVEEVGLMRQAAEKYRRLVEQAADAQPFAHPYYWAAFTVTGW